MHVLLFNKNSIKLLGNLLRFKVIDEDIKCKQLWKNVAVLYVYDLSELYLKSTDFK